MNLIRQMQSSLRGATRCALAALLAAASLFAAGCTPPESASSGAGNNANAVAANGAKKPTVTVTQGTPARQAATPAPALETVPPDVWNAEIQALDGKTFRLSDFKDKTIVLDIWATWCGPCRLDVPHLVEMTDDYKNKGVQVIGLTTENPVADEEKVRDFVEEFKINYKIGWATAAVALPLMQGSGSIPQTFVIAPGGKILVKYRGYSAQKPAAIRAMIDKSQDAKTGD